LIAAGGVDAGSQGEAAKAIAPSLDESGAATDPVGRQQTESDAQVESNARSGGYDNPNGRPTIGQHDEKETWSGNGTNGALEKAAKS
jgi:hypothetical protein